MAKAYQWRWARALKTEIEKYIVEAYLKLIEGAISWMTM
jgi:hypothetical protein